MAKQYSKEELWKLYEKLPEELKDTIFAEDTANSIENICRRNELEEEQIPKVAELVGYVLLGILRPEELEEALEKEMKLKKKPAKKIAQELHRLVFFPVKGSLETLHRIEVGKPAEGEPPEVKPAGKPAKPEEPKGLDIYREPIE